MTDLDPIDPQARAFLQHNLGAAQVLPLASDASARRYFRLPEQGLLLMDDRQDLASFAAYLRVAEALTARGLSAPKVHAAEAGLALIADWGTTTYANQLAAGGSEEGLYALAVDALLHLHHAADLPDLPRYDLTTHLQELRIFCDWFVPAIAPELDLPRFTAEFLALWEAALAPIAGQYETMVLRDFHIDNLMELAAESGVRRCGLLDFQDAVLGACEYDLVSLLQDARRDLSEGLEQRMLARYVAGAPEHLGGAGVIAQRYALLGAQRHTRIAGVFVRLCQRDGKAGYLKWLPRVLGQMEAALSAPELQPIAQFLRQELPNWRERCTALA